MPTQKTKLQISKIPRLNTLIIKQEGTDFFIPTKNGIIISVQQLANLIYYIVKLEYMSPKVLEGILEDFNTSK